MKFDSLNLQISVNRTIIFLSW